MEATRPVPLPELCATGRGQTIRVSLDTASNLDGGYRDLVVAEVRHTEAGDWEVYARPLSRPTEGRRLQITYGPNDEARVVASPAELDALRLVLADAIPRATPSAAAVQAAAQPAVRVANVGPGFLHLAVDVQGTTWLVSL